MLSSREVILGKRIITHKHGKTVSSKIPSSKIVKTIYSCDTEVLHSEYYILVCYQQPAKGWKTCRQTERKEGGRNWLRQKCEEK
jgi:hypothetical protein